ncbi:hypothetical protein B0H17DRAFT_944646, partial [Mycena rosella]
TSVFAIDPSPQSLFKVDAFAQKAVAASSIATGLGILCTAWFLLRYYRLQSSVFKTRAKDINGSYLSFSLSARLPMLGALVSLAAMVAFIGRIAYNTLPAFVIVLAIAFCLIMGLQFLVRGSEMLYSFIVVLLTVVAAWTAAYRMPRRVDPESDAGFTMPNDTSANERSAAVMQRT